MKNKTRVLLLSFMVVVLLFAGCGKSSQDTQNSKENSESTQQETQQQTQQETQQETQQSVTIQNFGVETTYTDVPKRAVPLSYDAAQILVALGLEDRIVAVATAEGSHLDCLPEYQEKLGKLEVLVEGTPNFELLLSKNPDFVYATVYTFGKSGVAPVEDFQREKINFYCMNGTYSEHPSVSDIYKDIEDLGKIFRKESEAEKLIAQLKERENALKEKSVSTEVKVMAFDGGDKTAITCGQGIENEIITLAGGKNIFGDLEHEFESVAWEEVAKRNPDLIVIHSYDQGVTRGSVEEKIQALKDNPALANVNAVKNDNFVVVKLVEVFPGIQVFDAAERIHQKIMESVK